MDIGKNRSLVTMAKEKVFVHFSATPFVIACIGKSNLNVGLLQSFADEMLAVVSGISVAGSA